MKNTFNPTLLFLLLVSAMAFTSCNNMNDTPPEPNLTVVTDDAEVNMAFEDLDNISLTVLSNSGLSARTTAGIPAGNLCEGAIVSIDESTKKITINFGDGCTSTNGTIRKGIIKLAYTGNLLFPGAKITTTFDGYEVNGLKVEGTRTMTNKGVDQESNSISLEVKILNGKVTWPDATSATITSDQMRNLKLSTQGEYEVSITGTASGTNRSGMAYTSSVTDDLIFTKSCIESGVTIPNSGIIAFQFNDIEVTVDYGNGTCDKMATIFYPTGSKEVILD